MLTGMSEGFDPLTVRTKFYPENMLPALKPHQVARWLRISRWTLRRWRAVGIGPGYMAFGRHIRYDVSEVEEWLALQRVHSTDA